MRFAKTLPEAFYRRYLEAPSAEAYYSKKSGSWESIKCEEAFRFLLKAMAGLKREGFGSDQKIAILCENRFEWVMTDYAAQWMGGAVAAIYTTSSSDQIEYILNESGAKILFVSRFVPFERISELKNLSSLKTIVSFDELDSPKLPPGVKFISPLEFFRAEMPESEAKSLLPALKPETVSILLYTSGTTGEPKGVMLTHGNVMSNLEMFYHVIPLGSELTTVSFLPLSHIYERVVHSYFLLLGIKIWIAESVDKLIENLSDAKPEVMSCVPRIFEKMYAKIMEKIKAAPPFRKKIFFGAIWIGKRMAPLRLAEKPLPLLWKLPYFLADHLVFKNIRAITGGRARLFISGGAPLSQEIAEFFFSVGFTIIEGYGLSETCILSVNRPHKMKFGTVGAPFDGVQVKFAEDGEILIKGPTLMRGYFKRPDATAEVIDENGWFHTGDIGEMDSEGFLKITDRKKDLIISAAGKKIAPQPIENALKTDSLIESVCLVGDKRNFISALITPNVEFCKSWATSKGFTLKDADECAKSARLWERFKRTIVEINATLPQYSTIKDFRVLSQSFTIESGELTPTLKLKRRIIQERYKDVIDSMYKMSPGAYFTNG